MSCIMLVMCALLVSALFSLVGAQPLKATSLPCGVTKTFSYNERSYLVRLPNHASCSDGHTLPLAVAIHCFGCHATMEIHKFSDAADRLGFALAAPEGFGSSFNAPHCCGPAKEQSMDDSGFIDGLVSDLIAGSGGRFVATALFATGFSNGGFMSSHLADASKHAWAGLAPVSGHEYSVRRDRPQPVSIHHCATDRMVNMSGCCMAAAAHGRSEQMRPTCCCGIVADSCVSTQSILAKWMRTNLCSGSRSLPSRHAPSGAMCTVGTGCTAETSLCVHECHVHSDWAHQFPAADSILEFFGRQACQRHGGRSSSSATATTDVCLCARGRAGPHCLHEHERGLEEQGPHRRRRKMFRRLS